MRRFRARELTVAEALAELGLGRTRFYELYASYLAACARRRASSWGPAASGGKHRAPLPESVVLTLRKLLGAAPPCSFSLAASEALRRHDFAIDRATVRRRALREGLAQLGPRKKAPRPVRRWQVQHVGQLWQYDASPHRWFHGQERQPSLLEIIDFSQPRDPGRAPLRSRKSPRPSRLPPVRLLPLFAAEHLATLPEANALLEKLRLHHNQKELHRELRSTPQAAWDLALAQKRSALRPAPNCPWWPYVWSQRSQTKVGPDQRISIGSQRLRIERPCGSSVTRCLHPNGDASALLHPPAHGQLPVLLLHLPAPKTPVHL